MAARYTDWREGRRFRAFELQQQGWGVTAIAHALGVSKGAVSQWLTKAREHGPEALRAHPHPGHPPRLKPEATERLPELLAKGPQAYGFQGHVWTRRRVTEVVRRHFGVSYSRWQIGQILHRLHWSPQKPTLRATQRNESAIEAWKSERLPAIDQRQLKIPFASTHFSRYRSTVVASFCLLPKNSKPKRQHMSTIDTQTRRELTVAVSARYLSSSKAEKALILDEFVAITGVHRKHAIRLLNGGGAGKHPAGRGRVSIYDEAVRQALIVLWEASDRICGKRLKPLIPLLMSALERHGHLELDAVVRDKLLNASAVTIDRLPAPARSTGRKQEKRRATPAVRVAVPVRTFGDWKDPEPGYTEADLVAHCGGNMSGSFVHTLVLTDIATGWTECVPLVVRDSDLVVDALRRLQTTMPFPLRGIDTDNGGEFINETLRAYCLSEGLEFTRSRPYCKNDQARVEQKNGSVVRRLVGYGRLEGIAAAETLGRLYAGSRLFVNFFQPSFKLIEKQRFGARVSRRYETVYSPSLLGDTRRAGEVPTPRRLGESRSSQAARGNPVRTTPHRRLRSRTRTPHVSVSRCRPRAVPGQSIDALAIRRSTPHSSGRPQTEALLQHASGSLC